MSWRFLYQDVFKDMKNTSTGGSEFLMEESAVPPTPLVVEDEAYQKKLFENDLYVWSLLLLRNDDV